MKKHATRIAGILLSIAMFCIMLGAIIGLFTLNILAAPDSGAYTPRIGRDDIVGNLIYANGTPIYIEAGTSGGTAVYYFDGTAKKYVNESGAKGDDLSNYIIFGGSANLDGLKSNTSVTMSGGEVKAIYGGQKYGTRYGDAVIVVTGGKVNNLIDLGSFHRNNLGESSIGTAYVTIDATVKYVDNLAHKTSSGWIFYGKPFIPDGEDIIVENGKTMRADAGTTLNLKGSLVNNGTANIGENASISADGGITNNGAMNLGLGTKLVGTVNNTGKIIASTVQADVRGSGTIEYTVPWIPFSGSVTDLRVFVNGEEAQNVSTTVNNGKLWLWVDKGELYVKVNDKYYTGIYKSGTVELKEELKVKNLELGFTELKANGVYNLNASVEPAGAVYSSLEYILKDAGETGATLKDNILTVPYGGTVTITVKTTDSRGHVCEEDFEINVIHRAVSDIIGILPTSSDFAAYELPNVVTPADAAYNKIEWTVQSGSATIAGGFVTLNSSGNIVIRATIKDGLGKGRDFIKDYNINVQLSEKLDLSAGNITVSATDGGHSVTFGDGQTLNYGEGESIPITSSTETTNIIVVMSGNPTVILDGVTTTRGGDSSSEKPSMSIRSGATVNLILVGENQLTGLSGIEVEDGAALIIGGNGTLTAKVSENRRGAAIGGGGERKDCGDITINSGTIYAYGGLLSSGIGGSRYGNTGIITINGGNITAVGGKEAAGIGSGQSPNFPVTIIITGGVINATGGDDDTSSGAGIGAGGGGGEESGCNIWITGGDITATSSYGAGIGDGSEAGSKIIIRIDGGNIRAANTQGYAAAIGSGLNNFSSDSEITINGGTVYASGGGDNGVGIGAGARYSRGGFKAITINGGNITAVGTKKGAAIGVSERIKIENISITGGTIVASAGTDAACIGGGVKGVAHNITITGGNIKTEGEYYVALGAGKNYTDTTPVVGNGSEAIELRALTFNGATEDSIVESILGIDYGINDVELLDTNTFYFWVPVGIGDFSVTVDGITYICPRNGEFHTSHLNEYNENGFCDCGDYEAPTMNREGYYEIYNAGQLFWFSEQVAKGGDYLDINAILMEDIDLENRDWTPIGRTGSEGDKSFKGVFDGNGKTITGLNVTSSGSGNGFIGEVRGGTVKNFTIYGEVVLDNSTHHYTGGVIGSATGTAEGGSTVSGITSYVNVTLKAGVGEDVPNGSSWVAGMIGFVNYNTLVENCVWYGTLDLGAYRPQDGVGGLIGKANAQFTGTIRNCAALGTIKTAYKSGSFTNSSGTSFDTIFVGGILSYSVADAQTVIENCIWAGTLVNNTDLGEKAHISAVGSLSGYRSITDCYALDNMPYVTTNGSQNSLITVITAEQLRSGEIAYLLGREWGQDLSDSDAKPIPNGKVVYENIIGGCTEASFVYEYSNTEADIAADHVDDDTDHACDRGCGMTTMGEHGDNVTVDHKCDYCGADGFGEHADGKIVDHKCDYCGADGFGEHADGEIVDHKCDYCGAGGFGEHADGDDADHLCDYGCGKIADDGCLDTEKDGKCDECGADIAHDCNDMNTNHECDICGKPVSEHVDIDRNHACDNGCAEPIGAHEDGTTIDHKCDYCGAGEFGEHSDGSDGDHLCDYGCGKIADDGCFDDDTNGKCDECGDDMPEHPETADASIVFAILAVVSAGGFTIFASHKREEK